MTNFDIKQLKKTTVFSEMEIRAIYNEYQEFDTLTQRGKYVRTAAHRLKKKFEKIIESLNVLQKDKGINEEDRESSVQTVYDEMRGMLIAYNAIVEAREAEETGDLSLDMIIKNAVKWELLLFNRIAEETRKKKEQSKEDISEILIMWVKQIIEATPPEESLGFLNVFIPLLNEKVKQESRELGLIWAQPPYFDSIEVSE